MFRRYAYKYIKVDDIEIRYLSQGDRGQVIVLIPGLGCTADIWTHNLHELGKEHRVYALDIFAGLAHRVEKKFTAEFFITIMKNFIDTLQISRINIAGLSLGGGLALKYALQYPSLVEKLVLIGSAGLSRNATLPLRLASVPFLGEFMTSPGREKSAYFVKRLIYRQELITEELIDFFYKMDSRPESQRVFLKVIRSFCGIGGGRKDLVHSIVGNLDKIHIPVLLIWGRHDKIIPLKTAEIAIKKLPNSLFHCFEECGHFPNFEQPYEFNRLLSKFVADKLALNSASVYKERKI